jgi:predicted metal-dependent peptidase
MASSPDINFASAMRIAKTAMPYMTGMLIRFQLIMRPGMGTMGVDSKFRLYMDPAVLTQWSVHEIAGVLIHECMHLFLDHPGRCGSRDTGLFNIAGDLAINPGLKAARLQLPEKGVMPSDYGLPDNLTADEYYVKLLEIGGGGITNPNPNGKPGTGNCGGCAHSKDDNDQTQQAQSLGAEGVDSSTKHRVAKAMAEEMLAHANGKGRGSVPAGWLREAELLCKPATIPWERELQRILLTACDYKAGAVVHTFNNPSRRQAGLGYGVGSPRLPYTRCPIPEVCIFFDTSGSMSKENVETGLIEVQSILKRVGANITFMCCDHAVHAIVKTNDINVILKNLKGGGGSSFTPAFDAIKTLKNAPNIVVAFTDGDIGVPEECPPGLTVIWCLVERHHTPPTEAWGRAVWCVNKD